MSHSTSSPIRPARDADLPFIERWLEDQKQSEETLAVNWNLTKNVYAESGMLVYAHEETDQAIAYFWGSLNDPSSILEVKATHRNSGVGSRFVRHLVEHSCAINEPLLLIECTPVSSEGFWQRMGFTTFETWEKVYGSRTIKLTRELPRGGTPVEVIVRFLSEDSKYNGAPPLAQHILNAVKVQDGSIYLDQRLAHHHPDLIGGEGDLFIEIEIDGSSLTAYSGKCKHESSKNIGVEQCKNGFAVERIFLNATAS